MAPPGTRRAAMANRISAVVRRRTTASRREADEVMRPSRLRRLFSGCNLLPRFSSGGAWPDEGHQVWPPTVSSSSSTWSSDRTAVTEPTEWPLTGVLVSRAAPVATVEAAATGVRHTAYVDALHACRSESVPLRDLRYEATVAWVRETAVESARGSSLANPMGPLLCLSCAVPPPMAWWRSRRGPKAPLYVRYCANTHVPRGGQAEPDAPFPNMQPARNEVGKLMGWWSPWPRSMLFNDYVAALRRAMYPDWAQPTQPFTFDASVIGGMRLSVYAPSGSAYYI